MYYFESVEDKREKGKVKHDLYEILFIAFMSILCGGDGFEDMEDFAKYQENWLKKYIKLKNGIPSHDTFRNVLNMLEPKDFSERFIKMIKVIIEISGRGKEKEEETEEELVKRLEGAKDHLQIDGKSIKGSLRKDEETEKRRMIHTVNVLSREYGLCLSQMVVEENKYVSETEALREILELLDLKGKILSVDSKMSFRDIAEKIVEKKGDYIFAIKKNNKNTFELIEENKELILEKAEKVEEIEKKHGKDKRRVFYKYKLPELFRESIGFKNVKYLGIYENYDGKSGVLVGTRYFITSKDHISTKDFYKHCRDHWGVENKLHWELDVVFNEDGSKIKKGNSSKIMLILRQLAFNLLKLDTLSKRSLKAKKKRFIFDDEYRDKLLRGDLTGWI
jgi:predicted transposase YbfD/YdcC